MAVSYTHLDVYKRQQLEIAVHPLEAKVHTLALPGGRQVEMPPVQPHRIILGHIGRVVGDRIVDIGIPVSYTHLDVYKRQGFPWAGLPGNFPLRLIPSGA